MSNMSTQPAAAILNANDRGGFTIPTPRLYPYQWNWDSVFAALGFSTFNQNRAWLELEMLFEGQWPDGMVPHIIFRQNDPDYFPGPDTWQSNTIPASSGHSQPPVAASVVLKLVQEGDDAARQRGTLLYPKLLASHRWFHDCRDPDKTGLVAIVHPWESGRDNCPDWDTGMAQVDVPADLERYQRRDLKHVDADQRPDAKHYDRFLTLVKYGRERNWDHDQLYRHGPFLMADPGVQFILLRADRDLLQLARLLGKTADISLLKQWIARSEKGSQLLWNDRVSSFCSLDLKTGVFGNAVTNASMLSFYADVGTPTQREIMADHAREILAAVRYGFPSWDPRHAQFESRRYWRGPVWAIMNYMVSIGFAEQGEPDIARRIQRDTLELIDKGGYFEYFDPLNGDGLGGNQFTWTAAIQLAWKNTSASISTA